MKKIGINSFKVYKLRVEIYGLENFLKLYKINSFGLHPRRKKDFMVALKKIKKFDHPLQTAIGSTLTTFSEIPAPCIESTTSELGL